MQKFTHHNYSSYGSVEQWENTENVSQQFGFGISSARNKTLDDIATSIDIAGNVVCLQVAKGPKPRYPSIWSHKLADGGSSRQNLKQSPIRN